MSEAARKFNSCELFQSAMRWYEKGSKSMSEAARNLDFGDLFESVVRLDRDIIRAIKDERMVLTKADIRYLVDLYYQLQDFRKSAKNELRAAKQEDEPNSLVSWIGFQMRALEKDVQKALDAWTETNDTCRWAKKIFGIGPIISAGLVAHIDIENTAGQSGAPTVGSLWRYAGLDPTCVWEKKQKRPWNARLRVLCWKIGDSWCKFHNHDKCHYGKVYADRKAFEIKRNDAGKNKDQAAGYLEAKKWKKTTEAYKAYTVGRLPKGQIENRARRYATKLFLAHWFDVEHRNHFGTEPPAPYPIAHLDGHTHVKMPPV